MSRLDSSKKTIRTYTGLEINVFDPDPDSISIYDIARSLSLQCRFGGHIKRFYSVAEHSILCSLIVDKEYKLEALMHDATEAYLMDIPRPIKNGIPQYVEIENKLMGHIAKKFNLVYPLPDSIWIADDAILQTEKNEVYDEKNENRRLSYLEPKIAESMFLFTFNELITERANIKK